jgi:hypothetical protein
MLKSSQLKDLKDGHSRLHIHLYDGYLQDKVLAVLNFFLNYSVDPLPLLLFNVAKNYTSPEDMKCPHSYITCGNNLLCELLQKFRILYSYTFHGVTFLNSKPYWYSEQCKMTSGLILYMQSKHQLYYSAFLIEIPNSLINVSLTTFLYNETMLENAQLLRKTSNSTKRVVYTASKAS